MITLKRSLGIELREDELVLSCLNKGFKGWSLLNFKLINYYWQYNRPDLEKELQQFLKKNSISREDIVLGVPRDKVIVRFIELPREVEENLNQVMRYQVESLTPVEDEMPYYDYTVLNRNADGPTLVIALVMIKRSVLDKYLNFLSEVKVYPNVVQISSVGLYNLFMSGRNNTSQQIHFIFDLNEGNLELIAIKDKRLSYSKYRRLENVTPDSKLMLSEIESAISTLGIEDGQIDKVYFAGKGCEAALDELRSKVGESKLLSEELPQDVRAHLQSFLLNDLTPSIGLALGTGRRKSPLYINLLPEDRRVKFQRMGYIPTYVLLGVLFILIVMFSVREFVQQRALLASLDKEIEALKPKIEEVKKVRKEVETMGHKIKFIDTLVNKQDTSLELLKDLTTKFPDDSYLQTLTLSNKGDINLSGLTSTASTSLAQTLEKSSFLRDVELQSSYKDPTSGKERFTIKAKLREK